MKEKSGFRSGFMVTLGIVVCLALVAGIVYGSIVGMQAWTIHQFNSRVISGITDNTVKTEAAANYKITTPNRTVEFFLTVNMSNNQTITIGKFEMDYRLVHPLDAPTGLTQLTVVYKTPETWFITNASDFNVSAEFKMRNPPRVERVHRDPVFYRGKDYPSNVPFNEIEVTTNQVEQYIDTNETVYYTRIRVSEDHALLNIKSVQIYTPPGITVEQ